jgi:putative membrane protein insertion efficiency factor
MCHIQKEPKAIKVGDDHFELNVSEKDFALIQRHFSKYTERDTAIRQLDVPKSPIWLNMTVRAIRNYQDNVSSRLGNRCVFDPSCSHYAEIAFRNHGFFQGIKLTLNRLWRCRGENGGIDELI